MAKSKGKKRVTKKTVGIKRSTIVPETKFKYPIKSPALKDGHVWDTERLRVYLQTLISPDAHASFVFTGWRLDVAWPRSAVTATIGLPNKMLGKLTAPVWWIAVDEECRREGFAMELLESIHIKWLPIYAYGSTAAGDKFCEAFYKKVGPLLPPTRATRRRKTGSRP